MANICPCTMGNSISAALSNLRNAKKLNNCVPEQTAPATLISRTVRHEHTMKHQSPYRYLLTFRLESGEELQLETNEDLYCILKEDLFGTLTWQGDTVTAFETGDAP